MGWWVTKSSPGTSNAAASPCHLWAHHLFEPSSGLLENAHLTPTCGWGQPGSPTCMHSSAAQQLQTQPGANLGGGVGPRYRRSWCTLHCGPLPTTAGRRVDSRLPRSLPKGARSELAGPLTGLSSTTSTTNTSTNATQRCPAAQAYACRTSLMPACRTRRSLAPAVPSYQPMRCCSGRVSMQVKKPSAGP